MWEFLNAVPPSRLYAFLSAAILLNLTPGADVLFATSCGLRGGIRAGVSAGIGTAIGSLWHIALSALGLSALLVAFPGALTALKWAGAGYICWLAWQSWRAAGASVAQDQGQGIAPAAALYRAFLINAFNPKVALFMLAFLPQFTDPALGPIWRQILFLGLVMSATGGVITAAYGAAAGAMGASLAQHMSVLNRIAAIMLVILALRLIFH